MVNFVLPTEPIRTPPVRERVTREEARLSFFPTAEGYYDYEKKTYIYQYKDHLGNTRVSYARIKGKLEILDQNDYYPFGMNHLQTGSSRFGMGSWQNYKYNGKELQASGMYDYGARFYMPDSAERVYQINEQTPF